MGGPEERGKYVFKERGGSGTPQEVLKVVRAWYEWPPERIKNGSFQGQVVETRQNSQYRWLTRGDRGRE